MVDDSVSDFGSPAICRKKVTAAFDGGRLTSDGGVLLLAQAERVMGVSGQVAGCIADPRDQVRIVHGLSDILRARIFTIACGHEDADDLDHLRHDPGFKLAVGKLPGGATVGNADYARAFAESARSAVLCCSPLTLPPGLYDLWKSVEINFDPESMTS